jgi:hypothetical protein
MKSTALSARDDLDVMLHEYNTLRREMLSWMERVQTFGAVLVTAGVTGLGAIYAFRVPGLVLLFPPALLAFFTLETANSYANLKIGRYLAVVEGRINALCGKRLLHWESFGAHRFGLRIGAGEGTSGGKGIINPEAALGGLLFLLVVALYLGTLTLGVVHLLSATNGSYLGRVAACLFGIVHIALGLFLAYARLVYIGRAAERYKTAIERSLLQAAQRASGAIEEQHQDPTLT